MKALTVDFDLIVQSMRDLCRLNDDFYMDKSTGKIFALSRSLIRSLEGDRSETAADLPEWDAQMIPLAREIVLAGSTQYVRVPEAFGNPEHRWMNEFARSVTSFRLKQKLIVALRGRGSCHRFKEILKSAPDEARRWSEFHQARWEERIQAWFETQGILGVNARPRAVRASQ
jgi:hypothetical protein